SAEHFHQPPAMIAGRLVIRGLDGAGAEELYADFGLTRWVDAQFALAVRPASRFMIKHVAEVMTRAQVLLDRVAPAVWSGAGGGEEQRCCESHGRHSPSGFDPRRPAVRRASLTGLISLIFRRGSTHAFGALSIASSM